MPCRFAVHLPTYLELAVYFFFFNDTATTEIYTLSLHDALPISHGAHQRGHDQVPAALAALVGAVAHEVHHRSEEHTSELQSPCNLVCRLLLEKKKTTKQTCVAILSRGYTSHCGCSLSSTSADFS